MGEARTINEEIAALPGAVVGRAWPVVASLPHCCCSPSTVHCSPRGCKEPPTALAANPPSLQRELDWRRPAIPRRWLPDGDCHKQAQHSLTSGEHLGGSQNHLRHPFLTKRTLVPKNSVFLLTSVSVFKRVLKSIRIDLFDMNWVEIILQVQNKLHG